MNHDVMYSILIIIIKITLSLTIFSDVEPYTQLVADRETAHYSWHTLGDLSLGLHFVPATSIKDKALCVNYSFALKIKSWGLKSVPAMSPGGYSGFQGMSGMIEWGQKSKPPKIPRASNNPLPKKIPVLKITPPPPKKKKKSLGQCPTN